MKIVIDTNIVFSAILNTQSRIGLVIINGSKYFDFYSANLLKQEIFRHKSKILKISKYSEEDFSRIYDLITSKIKFINDDVIPDITLKKAIEVVSNIDVDDALFVALNDHIEDADLWTGDLQLFEGLKRKEYLRVISTEQILNLYFQKELKRRKKNK